jgi:hypothetical protein
MQPFVGFAASVIFGSLRPFAAPRIKVCYGPFVSFDTKS